MVPQIALAQFHSLLQEVLEILYKLEAQYDKTATMTTAILILWPFKFFLL